MNIRTLLAIMTIGVVSTAFSSGVVKNVTARQIRPWNGLVEIQYELTEDVKPPPGNDLCTTVICEDREHGTNYSAMAFTSEPTYTKGVHKLIWDAKEDDVEIDSKAVVFKVSIGTALYCVIDLSRGKDAAKYPVVYLAKEPDAGWTDEYKTTKLVLRRIEAGTFKMQNQYDITLTKPFYIGVFEVTQRQYELVLGSNPSYNKGEMRPVENVGYDVIRGTLAGAGWPANNEVDADSYLGKLRARTGLDLDLPTEAQWEYACRAGTTSDYNNGGSDVEDLKKVGRYLSNRGDGRGGYDEHTIVGSYLSNKWGLYDMHGNVWEWCRDWYAGVGIPTDWRTGTTADPKGAASGTYRISRGGAWDALAKDCGASERTQQTPSWKAEGFGFRLLGNL